jgi:hypothetical protein
VDVRDIVMHVPMSRAKAPPNRQVVRETEVDAVCWENENDVEHSKNAK